MLTASLSRLGCAAVLALGLAAPVAAAPVKASAEYAVTLGGTHVATVEVTLADDGGTYDLGLDARISGLARLVATGTAKLHSTGNSTGSGLRSQKFDLLTRASGEDFTVAVTYASGNVNSFVVDPPVINNIDRVAIERKQLAGGINDMAAAFVLKGGELDRSPLQASAANLHGDRALQPRPRLRQGRRRHLQAYRLPGPRGALQRALHPRCRGTTPRPRSPPTSRRTSTSCCGTRPLATRGYFIPYRALVATDAGDLSIVLTSLTQ